MVWQKWSGIRRSHLAIKPEHIPAFNARALYLAIQEDKKGNITFRDFLRALWGAGVVSYTVDFILRTVTYYGVEGGACKFNYPKVR